MLRDITVRWGDVTLLSRGNHRDVISLDVTSHVLKKLKADANDLPATLDLFAIVIDAISLLSLLLVSVVGLRAIRAFRQSRQAVTEAASLISVIVDALSSRIARSESVLTALRSDMATSARRDDVLEEKQDQLRDAHKEIVRQLQDVMSSDKRLIAELEQLKSRITEIPAPRQMVEGLPKPENLAAVISEEDILASLTPTEHHTLEILRVEGAKGAPELGKRLKKSREHTSRLMKKLYLEGYVSRESNHAPFRYKLSDVVRSALESSKNQIMEEPSETS